METCTNDVRDENDWDCLRCVKPVGADFDAVLLQNAILGIYDWNVFRCAHSNFNFTRSTAALMSALMHRKLRYFKNYKIAIGRKMHPSTLQYWNKYGKVPAEGDHVDFLEIPWSK